MYVQLPFMIRPSQISVLTAWDWPIVTRQHWFENKRRDRIYGKPSENVHTAADDLSDQTDKEKAPFFRYPM